MNNKNKLSFVTAESFYKKITDGTHDSPKRRNFGKKLITSKHIKGVEIDFSSAYLISENDFNFINLRSSVDQWDVIISMIGEYCGFCYVERNKKIDYAVKNVGLFKTGSEVEAKWLYYYLKSPIGKKYLKSVRLKTSQPYLTLDGLRKLPILRPKNQKHQKNIIGILSTIDKKIELNNKSNNILEAISKLIYEYWFVQFEFPNQDGKPYKSSGGEMVFNNELNCAIPRGWNVGKLSDLEPNIVTGKTPSTSIKENFGGLVPFICIGDVRGNMHVTKTEITLSNSGAESQAMKFIPEGTICVTCIASPGLVAFASERSQTNQQINSVICKRDSNRCFLYFYLKNYFRYAKAKSGNTFANMNKDDFSSIIVLQPKEEILEKYSEIVKASFDRILLNSREINKLVELRDWLLPMLFNGQIKVRENIY